MKLSTKDPIARKVGMAFLMVFVLRVITVYLFHHQRVPTTTTALEVEEEVAIAEEWKELDDWKQVYEKLGEELLLTGLHTPQPLALATYIAQQSLEVLEFNGTKQKSVKSRELKELQEHLELMELADSPNSLGSSLKERGYHLLRQEPSFYLAYNPTNQKFLVNVIETRGISQELLRQPGANYTLPNNPLSILPLPHNPLTSRGTEYNLQVPTPLISVCSKLLQEIEPVLIHLAIPGKYQIVLQGHGMAGGIATLLGMAVRAQIPSYRKRIRVFAFAPPAVLPSKVALASASFVTSILHPYDSLPRLSSSWTVETTTRILTKLEEKFQSKGIALNDRKFISKLLTGQQSPPLSAHKFQDLCRNVTATPIVQQDKEHYRMIAGRIISLNDPPFATDALHPQLQLLPVSKQLYSNHNRYAYTERLQSVMEAQGKDDNDPENAWWEGMATVLWNTVTAFVVVLFFTETLWFLQKYLFPRAKPKNERENAPVRRKKKRK